jgi:hypothetical protein
MSIGVFLFAGLQAGFKENLHRFLMRRTLGFFQENCVKLHFCCPSGGWRRLCADVFALYRSGNGPLRAGLRISAVFRCCVLQRGVILCSSQGFSPPHLLGSRNLMIFRGIKLLCLSTVLGLPALALAQSPAAAAPAIEPKPPARTLSRRATTPGCWSRPPWCC